MKWLFFLTVPSIQNNYRICDYTSFLAHTCYDSSYSWTKSDAAEQDYKYLNANMTGDNNWMKTKQPLAEIEPAI